ncbi:MAG: PRC-barrel domain-containing protein [Defluviicoccus sp.]
MDETGRCQLLRAAGALLFALNVAPAWSDELPAPKPPDLPSAEPATEPGTDNPERAAPQKPADVPPVVGILGKQVRGPNDEDMGKVIEVLVDRNGRPIAALIDFGGFLGVGSRKVAVIWDALRFDATAADTPVRIALGRSDVQAAPEYKPSSPLTDIIGWRAPPDPAPAPQN